MFEWKKENGTLMLVHTAKNGDVKHIDFHDVTTYYANLHASERQSPLPPFPLEEAAADAADDAAVLVAAESHPDALRAAIGSALAKSEACMLAADVAAEKASESALGAWQALRELRDFAASLAPREPEPAPIVAAPDNAGATDRWQDPRDLSGGKIDAPLALAVIEGQGTGLDVADVSISARVPRPLTPPL